MTLPWKVRHRKPGIVRTGCPWRLTKLSTAIGTVAYGWNPEERAMGWAHAALLLLISIAFIDDNAPLSAVTGFRTAGTASLVVKSEGGHANE